MSATCVLQTRVDEKTKERAQKEFAKRGMTVSEGLRLALDHEIGGSCTHTGSISGRAFSGRETSDASSPSTSASLSAFSSISASERLQSVFSDADEKIEASGIKEPTIESIVEFCDSIKQQRANEATELQW